MQNNYTYAILIEHEFPEDAEHEFPEDADHIFY